MLLGVFSRTQRRNFVNVSDDSRDSCADDVFAAVDFRGGRVRTSVHACSRWLIAENKKRRRSKYRIVVYSVSVWIRKYKLIVKKKCFIDNNYNVFRNWKHLSSFSFRKLVLRIFYGKILDYFCLGFISDLNRRPGTLQSTSCPRVGVSDRIPIRFKAPPKRLSVQGRCTRNS